MGRFKLIFTLLLLGAGQIYAQEQPFILHKAQIRLDLRQEYFNTNEVYLLGATEAKVPNLQQYRATLGLQYGLTSRLTLQVHLGLLNAASLNRQVGASSGDILFPGSSVSHIADQQVGANYLLLKRKATTLSAWVRVGIPSGLSTQADGLLTGDGEWDQSLGFQLVRQCTTLPLIIALRPVTATAVRGLLLM